MPLSLENANSVKQKVKIALTNAHPVHQGVFKALFEYLATQGLNPDLQFVAFTEAQCDAAGAQTSWMRRVRSMASTSPRYQRRRTTTSSCTMI